MSLSWFSTVPTGDSLYLYPLIDGREWLTPPVVVVAVPVCSCICAGRCGPGRRLCARIGSGLASGSGQPDSWQPVVGSQCWFLFVAGSVQTQPVVSVYVTVRCL